MFLTALLLEQYLQYKMFLLNITTYLNKLKEYQFTIQNVSIK